MSEIVLQLSGEDGNAFSILGRARRTFRKAGIPIPEIDAWHDDAMSGDYDHLLQCTMDFADKHGIEVQ